MNTTNGYLQLPIPHSASSTCLTSSYRIADDIVTSLSLRQEYRYLLFGIQQVYSCQQLCPLQLARDFVKQPGVFVLLKCMLMLKSRYGHCVIRKSSSRVKQLDLAKRREAQTPSFNPCRPAHAPARADMTFELKIAMHRRAPLEISCRFKANLAQLQYTYPYKLTHYDVAAR